MPPRLLLIEPVPLGNRGERGRYPPTPFLNQPLDCFGKAAVVTLHVLHDDIAAALDHIVKTRGLDEDDAVSHVLSHGASMPGVLQ